MVCICVCRNVSVLSSSFFVCVHLCQLILSWDPVTLDRLCMCQLAHHQTI